MRRGVDPKYKKMGEEATEWAGSSEGQAAFDRSVEAGHKGTEYLRKAEREGAERIGNRARLIGIEPRDDSLGFLLASGHTLQGLALQRQCWTYFFNIPVSENEKIIVPS